MSRYCNPQQFKGRVEGLSRRDGTRGYLVTHHWWQWKVLSLLVVLTGATVGLLWSFVGQNPAVICGIVGVVFLAWRAWVIKNDFLLVTRHAIYHRRVRVWKFERDTDVYKQTHVQQLKIEIEGLNIVRSKRVRVVTAGQAANLVYVHAGGGDEMSRAVNDLTTDSR